MKSNEFRNKAHEEKSFAEEVSMRFPKPQSDIQDENEGRRTGRRFESRTARQADFAEEASTSTHKTGESPSQVLTAKFEKKQKWSEADATQGGEPDNAKRPRLKYATVFAKRKRNHDNRGEGRTGFFPSSRPPAYNYRRAKGGSIPRSGTNEGHPRPSSHIDPDSVASTFPPLAVADPVLQHDRGSRLNPPPEVLSIDIGRSPDCDREEGRVSSPVGSFYGDQCSWRIVFFVLLMGIGCIVAGLVFFARGLNW